jgi:hypothetical protein
VIPYFLRDALRGDAYRDGMERVVQRAEHHVDQAGVTHACAEVRIWSDGRRAAHVFGAPSNFELSPNSADLLDQGPIVPLEKQEQIACERLLTLARSPKLCQRSAESIYGTKAGSNLLRISMIKLHRNDRPAISVGIYRGPTGASNESNQDIQADR